MNNDKLVVSSIAKSFVIPRVLWIFWLIAILWFVVINWNSLSAKRMQDLYYEPSDPSYWLVIKETDKSAFETLTEKDIENQFNEVLQNLTINKINYDINTRDIWVNNPFLTWDAVWNKYIDKDLKEKIDLSKSAANQDLKDTKIQ